MRWELFLQFQDPPEQQERLLRFQGQLVRRELFLQFQDPPVQQEHLLWFQGPPVQLGLFLQFQDPRASEETQERQDLQVPRLQGQQELQDPLDSGETV